MPVSLQVTNGPSIGMRIHIVRGLVVRIGRTEWADYSFPADTSMADIHFAIHTEGTDCEIRDLSSGAGTLVNGAPVKDAVLHTGDAVSAGRTIFAVVVEGEQAPLRPTAPAKPVADQEQSKPTAPAPVRAIDLCGKIKMSEQARQVVTEESTPEDYLNLLIEQELYTDGLRFLAFWLPKPAAVNWACESVAQICGAELTKPEQAAFDAARQWANDPSEANRRAAESAASATEFSGAASWLALGAFWSGGSLSGPDLPVVPPADGLTAEAITGAFMLAATRHEPQKAVSRYQEILTRGQQLIPQSTSSTVPSESPH
jgi:pSer/pThr/pTyr-binding forkhead associated (FHA) protein